MAINKVDTNEELIEKYKNNIQEIGQQILQKKELMQIEYNSAHIKTLEVAGCIPKDLSNWYFKQIDEKGEPFKEFEDVIKNNPNVPIERRIAMYLKSSQPDAALKFYEDIAMGMQLLKLLIENKDKLTSEITQDFPSSFFKTIQRDEFGISRMIADPLNQVPQILEKLGDPKNINDDLFILQSEYKNSTGDKIRFEYRFRAQNQEEANRHAKTYGQRMGRLKKAYEACWAMANKKKRRIVSCDLTDLMVIAHPGRKKESFSVHEKTEFFKDLLDTSGQQFVVTKNEQSTKGTRVCSVQHGNNRNNLDAFILPFLTIFKTSEYNLISNKESDRYPNQISYSVLHNPLYEHEALYNVGAGIKHRTLELQCEDLGLAEWIQVRKSQAMKSKYINMDRDFLIKLARLQGTKHVGCANRNLLRKLKRLKEKGIIIDCPQKITNVMRIQIR